MNSDGQSLEGNALVDWMFQAPEEEGEKTIMTMELNFYC